MARIAGSVPDPHHDPIPGAHLTIVKEEVVAKFAAYVVSGHTQPAGDLKLTMNIPFNQIPLAMGLMRYQGGTVFEVTVRRVPRDQLPEGGWD